MLHNSSLPIDLFSVFYSLFGPWSTWPHHSIFLKWTSLLSRDSDLVWIVDITNRRASEGMRALSLSCFCGGADSRFLCPLLSLSLLIYVPVLSAFLFIRSSVSSCLIIECPFFSSFFSTSLSLLPFFINSCQFFILIICFLFLFLFACLFSVNLYCSLL